MLAGRHSNPSSQRLMHKKIALLKRGDFRFGPLNVFLLVVLFVAGLIVHLNVYEVTVDAVLFAICSAIALSVILSIFPFWEMVVILAAGDALSAFWHLRPDSEILIITAVVASIIAPSIQIAFQLGKAVLLRFGKFRGLRKSGLFIVFPVMDKVTQFVDQRVRVTDFSAETTLTSDTVPVNVDAIAFWMVWDAQKAVLEVEHFAEAIVLSAQTALRNAIGMNDLAVLLSERERLGKEVQRVLEEKTSAWGITTQAVEIRDIVIPKGLEDAMSRQAQAERERQSRIILGTAEAEIAEKFAKASEHYQDNSVALHLRAMNMVFEGLKQKGSMIIVPSTAVETMGLGALGGLTAFDRGDAAKAAQAPPEKTASME
jgi:regulator of protease activity HflC (stomatin/prohibitin superfamily)